MKFKLGNKVSVLDEDITGTIVKIVGNVVTIESEDGFDLQYDKTELLVINNESNIASEIFSKKTFSQVVNEKESPKKRSIKKVKPKERFQPTMEVDLHIHQLTEARGLSSHDMLALQLDAARRQLEFAINKRIQKMVFIHGVGEGVLKMELEYLFGRYNNIKYYDADYQKYGLGATEVYIYQNVKATY